MKKANDLVAAPLRHFRAKVAKGADRVDRTSGRYGFGLISGVSVITRGEALGHQMWVDRDFLQATADAINARSEGLKARFTHPGMSSDGLGTYLGKVDAARVEGDRVIADLHFAEASTKTPDGDLADYVMSLAESAPEDFGVSIVFDVDAEAMQGLSDANTINGRFVSPDELNKNNFPHARMSALRAADVVDSPAANPDGLFRRGQEIADEADRLMEYALGLSTEVPQLALFDADPTRVAAAVQRFLTRHDLRLERVSTMPDQAPANPQPTREDFAAECKRFIAAFGAKGGEWFADGKTYSDCQNLLIAELRQQLSERDARIAELSGKLAAIDLGEDKPVNFGTHEPAQKPQAASLKAGMLGKISINGRVVASSN
jgi:hypothetical protein